MRSTGAVNDRASRNKAQNRLMMLARVVHQSQATWVDFSEDGKWKDMGLFGVHGNVRQFEAFADMVKCVKDEAARLGVGHLSCKERIYSLLTFSRVHIICRLIPWSLLTHLLSMKSEWPFFRDLMQKNVERVKKEYPDICDIAWKVAFLKSFEVSW